MKYLRWSSQPFHINAVTSGHIKPIKLVNRVVKVRIVGKNRAPVSKRKLCPKNASVNKIIWKYRRLNPYKCFTHMLSDLLGFSRKSVINVPSLFFQRSEFLFGFRAFPQEVCLANPFCWLFIIYLCNYIFYIQLFSNSSTLNINLLDIGKGKGLSHNRPSRWPKGVRVG